MLILKNAKLAFGAKILFDNANLQLYKLQRIGLIGQNGAGKTSLFKMLLNQLLPDAGSFSVQPDTLLAYVEQEITEQDTLITDYVLNSHPLIINDHTDLPEYYSLRPNAEKLLINLGFAQEELYLPLSNFSGGWQMRANLAKALFVPSDMLLLDEPTNHLDIETVIWLEDWLNRYQGLAVIISHDREFLDNVTTHTLALANKKLTMYSGNYSTYENTRYLQMEQQNQLVKKNQAKVDHLQKFVDRFKAKASLAKQAQSKMKMIEKLKITESIASDLNFSINFLEPEYQVDKLITLDDVSFGYYLQNTNDGNHIDDKPYNILIDHVKLNIFKDNRIGLLGRNGVGKSTLIKGIINHSTIIKGEISSHPKIKIGYFAQNTVDELDLNDTPLGFFISQHKTKKESELRAYLGRYGFSGDKINERIKCFSGGEKARLSIANIIYHRPNVLFLDEPTNHLDMQLREELARSIQDFEGAVIIVSHDKFLLQSVVDQFYLIANNKLTVFDGDLEEYHQLLLKKDKPDSPSINTKNQKRNNKINNNQENNDKINIDKHSEKINNKYDKKKSKS